MKVIFDESFLTKISKIGNTLTITSYTLGTYYKNITSISELFLEDYINNDPNKSKSLEILNSIWEKEERVFKLNISDLTFAEDLLSNDEINFIYVYYKEIGIEDENLAFILSGDLVKVPGDRYQIEGLNLSITNNLIDIFFPENTVANIEASQNDDTKFLEGVGIKVGNNLFTDEVLESSSKTELCSRESSLKYIRNNKTSGNSEELPYLDINGEEVTNYYSFVEYKNLVLTTENVSYSGGDYVDRSLKSEGGEVQLLGTFSRIRYFVKNDRIINQVEETGNLFGLDGSVIKVTLDEGLNYRIDEPNWKVIYDKNDNPNNNLSITIQLYEKIYNPLTKEIVTKTSNTLRLLQGNGNYEWNVNSDSPYREGSSILYLLNSNRGDEQGFSIITDLAITDDDISIESDDNQVFNFFDVNCSTGRTGYKYYIDVRITTETDNESEENWNPYLEKIGEDGEIIPGEFESRLIKIRIVVKETIEEGFYVVQSPKIGGLKMCTKFSTNSYPILDVVFLGEPNLPSNVYPAKTDDSDVNNYWKILNSPNTVTIEPTSGLLNSQDTENWDNPEDSGYKAPVYFSVKTEKSPESINDEFLGNLILGRVVSEDFEVDLNDWRSAVMIGQLTKPIYLQGTDPIIDVPEEIHFDSIGCYSFYIKSNCLNDVKISIDSPTESIVSFNVDPSSPIYTYTTGSYNINSGIPCYIYLTRNKISGELDESKKIGEIKVYPQGSILNSKSISLYLDPIEPEINYYRNPQKFIYVPDSTEITDVVDINLTCNVSTSNSFNPGSENYNLIINKELPFIDKNPSVGSNRGYNYTTISSTLTSSVSNSWPAKYVGTLLSAPYNNIGNIEFYIFKLGPNPQISLDGNSTISSKNVTLGSPANSYVDMTVTTIYPIETDSPVISFNSAYESIYSGKVSVSITVKEYITGNYKYLFRIRSQVANTDPVTKFIGTFTITSLIDSKGFINENSGYPPNISIPSYSQSEINSIVPPVTKTINIYQEGIPNYEEINVTPESGTVKDTDPYANSIKYIITAPTNYTVSKTNKTPDYGVLNVSTPLNRVTYTTYNIDDSPINLYDNGVIFLPQYASRIENRKISFNVTIYASTSGGSINKSFDLGFTQRGWRSCFVYSSRSVSPTMEFGIVETKYETVEYDETSFSFNLGVYKNWPFITEGSSGILPRVSSDSLSIQSDIPIFRTGHYDPVYNNVTVSFDKNDTMSVKEYMINVYYNDEDTLVVTYSSIILRHIPKGYSVISSIGDTAYFHSSGHCIMSSSELDVLDPSLETNLPRERVGLKSSNGISIKDWSITYLGPGSGDGISKYKLMCKISPNMKDSAITSEKITLYDTQTNEDKVSWEVKQGYLNLYVEYNEEKINGGGGIIGSIDNPIEVPAKNSLEGNRVIFPFRASNREYSTDGVLGEDKIFNKDDYDINTASGYLPTWTSQVGNINSIFSSHNSEYIIEDNKYPEQVPFIEHTYETSDGYITQEVPFKVTLNMFTTYTSTSPTINEKSTNYDFTFFMKKLSSNS